MSTVHDGQSYIVTQRRRPAKTATGAAQTRKIFSNNVRKELPIPDFIDEYNCYMCGVDIADQLRSYYNTQRAHRKTWKPLFHFLLDTVVGNCYLLSSYRPVDRYYCREKSHKQFRKDLRKALFQNSTRARKHPSHATPSRPSINKIIWEPVVEHKLIKLGERQQNCSGCIEARKTTTEPHMARRKPLADLSINTTRKERTSKDWKHRQRVPRTQFGCSVCRIPFCRKGDCWSAHIKRISTKD